MENVQKLTVEEQNKYLKELEEKGQVIVEDFCKGFEEFLDDKIKNKFKNKQEIKGVVDICNK